MSDESAVDLLIESLNRARDSLRGSIPEWGELHLPASEQFINRLRSELSPLKLTEYSGLSSDREKCHALCEALYKKYEDTWMEGGPGALIPVLFTREILSELMYIIGAYRTHFLGD